MLIDFTVENFRSIKDIMLLSAIAQTEKKGQSATGREQYLKADSDIAPPFMVEGWGFELLPALGIFGANASGKSNVVNALNCLFDCMSMSSLETLGRLRLFPFMLDATSRNLPVQFELRVALEQTIYTYTLKLTSERVLFEALYYAHVSTKKDRLLYKRTWNEDSNLYNWKNGNSFVGPHCQLEGSLSEHGTFMSLLMRLKVPVIAPFIDWIGHHIMGVGYEHEWLDEWGAAQTAYQDAEFLDRISAIVRMFDTGIVRFEVNRSNSEQEGPGEYQIYAWHSTGEGEVKFPLMLESTGTRRLFGLANNILKVLDEGTLLVVDELGSNIHPHITRALVKMFQSPKTNPKRAQLIFTSHDNTLQRNQLLRRDQIWFTQKRANGSTKLYPLSDFKPRNDAAIDRSYFDGRYGAVPILPSEDELALITAGKR